MTRRRRSRRILTVAVLVAVLGAGLWVLYPRRVEVLAALQALDPLLVGLSTLLTVLGVGLTAQVWRSWLGALGHPVPTVTAHRLFYVTQSAKYLPGGLWPVAAQAAVSRRFGVPVAAMVTASSLFMLTHVVTGAATGLALLGPTADESVVVPSRVVAGCGLALLSPPGMRLVLRLARRLRLPVDLPVPGWAAVARALGLMLAAWACYGGALLCLARAAGGDDVGFLLATGAFASAWTLGFLALALPAGVGVRESVVVAALAVTVPLEDAIAVAVVSRAAFTLVDLALALASAGVVGQVPDGPAPARGRPGSGLSEPGPGPGAAPDPAAGPGAPHPPR